MIADIEVKTTKINVEDKTVYSIIEDGEELSLPLYKNNIFKNPLKWGW